MATFIVKSIADSGPDTLRAAILAANQSDTINFDPSIAGQTILLETPLTISNAVTIDTAGQKITIDGQSKTYAFDVATASNVLTTIRGLTVANGAYTGSSPAGAAGTNAAGGVYVRSGGVLLQNDIFSNDRATGGGGAAGSGASIGFAGGAAAGAVYAAAGTTLILTDDQFVNDMGTGGDGGLGVVDGPGGQAAGAVYVASGATVSASNLTFSGDSAMGGFGGPFIRGASYPNSNNDTVNAATCFASGTRIRTQRGEVAVENLHVGDRVVTASGGLRPIVWIGHSRLQGGGGALPHEQQPVRVRASAFGPGLPGRDLFLSPGHPVLVGADDGSEGGHLVPIMCLVNGTTIERIAVREVTYWHVELDAHDIVLAEGLPAESYLDWGDRAFFVEGADHALTNPDFVVPGLAGRCRPVALEGPAVQAERRRLDMMFATRLASVCAWPRETAPDEACW